MGKYRKIPVVIEATQWFRNGDHPEDYPVLMHDEEGRQFNGEGRVVRYFRRPSVPSYTICDNCGHSMEKHGWMDTLEGGHIVCPGDYIITGVQDEKYPCKPGIFGQTYESAGDHEND